MKPLFKYNIVLFSTAGLLKDVSIFGHLKRSSVAVVFAQLSGSLIVKRQWSTYSWLTTAWHILVVTQKIVCNRKKREKIMGILRTFIYLPKFRDLRAKQEKEKRVKKQSSTALFGAT